VNDDDLHGGHLTWRACETSTSACVICGIPVVRRWRATGRLARGEPVALEAYAITRLAAAYWVCLVCTDYWALYDWTFAKDEPDSAFHVTSAENRASIATHGLDWRRMGATFSIAGSPRPEFEGVFLGESPSDAAFFVGFKTPVDVWAVSTRFLELEPGPDGWVVSREPIGASDVRLVHADDARVLRPRSRRADGSPWWGELTHPSEPRAFRSRNRERSCVPRPLCQPYPHNAFRTTTCTRTTPARRPPEPAPALCATPIFEYSSALTVIRFPP